MSSADFFQNELFQKKIPSEGQTVWIQIRPDILSGLISVKLFAQVFSRRHKCKQSTFFAIFGHTNSVGYICIAQKDNDETIFIKLSLVHLACYILEHQRK